MVQLKLEVGSAIMTILYYDPILVLDINVHKISELAFEIGLYVTKLCVTEK